MKKAINNFCDLKGTVLKSIQILKEIDGDEIIFTLANGKKYRQYHRQCCCEVVYIEDISGDLNAILDNVILLAEEVSKECDHGEGSDKSETWTFYKLSTLMGSITIRWYGTSNGYYSEKVDGWERCDEDHIQ
jgi:hypothetical protein